MCGIVGLAGDTDPAVLASMAAGLLHRGPDDHGFHHGARVMLGARRLSIVDLAGGAQPIYSRTGDICLVANAEIYNHRELRSSLRARGHEFRTRCDIEVILHLYEEYGDACVEHLRGMFAFAIADGDRLLLARDRLGIKPLYYAALPRTLVFGSEIKAVLRHPEVPADLDLQAFVDSQVVGFPVDCRTMFAAVRAVPAGHIMVVESGGSGPTMRMHEYYALPTSTDASIGFEEAQDALVELIREAVASHLAADVEVGLMLSGGLDSTVLALAARDAGYSPMRAFGAFVGPGHPDLVQATRIADHLGWSYEPTLVDFDAYLAGVPAAVYASEEPRALGAATLHAAAVAMGRRLKVCLSGEGADELFGGYPEYVDHRVRAQELARRQHVPVAVGVPLSPRAVEIVETLSTDAASPGYLDRLFALNMREQLQQLHLQGLDKCTMAAGVEARVPFMDHRLVEFVTRLPSEYKVNRRLGIQKHLLKNAALRTWGVPGPLLDTVLRRKIGVPSGLSYNVDALAELCERELPDDYLQRHELGACFRLKVDLLLFELWHEMFAVGRGADPEALSLREFIAERAGAAAAAV